MPLLWRPHDRDRDVRAMAAAARTAGCKRGEPGESAMTRHGMVQPPAAGAQSSAMNPHVSILNYDADRVVVSRLSCRQSCADKRRSGSSISTRSLRGSRRTDDDISRNRNPHSHQLWPAGSCMRGFRTPAGTRNPSPHRSFRQSEPSTEKRTARRLCTVGQKIPELRRCTVSGEDKN